MFARTTRLLLRPAWDEDADALYGAIGDERIVRNLARAPWPYEPQHAAAFVAAERKVYEPNFLIFRVGAIPPELVGGIGLARTPDGDTELGYWIACGHWGQGYATEAGRALVAMARDALRIPRLVSGHFLDNPASGRVLRKLGFRPTGAVGARHSVARGEDVPMAEFELRLEASALLGPAAPPALAA